MIHILNLSGKAVYPARPPSPEATFRVLREILRLRKQDERDEQESLLDLYLRAMESAGSSQARTA